MRKKIIFFMILWLVFGGVGLKALNIQQNVFAQTSKIWNTYNDERYGFSIQYPERWQLIPFKGTRGGDFLEMKGTVGETNAKVYVVIQPKLEEQSLEEWIQITDDENQVLNEITQNINGVPTILREIISDEYGRSLTMYWAREEKVFLVNLLPLNDDTKPIFETLIASLIIRTPEVSLVWEEGSIVDAQYYSNQTELVQDQFPSLRFPFTCNQIWIITKGYYDDNPGHPPNSQYGKYALDFAEINGQSEGKDLRATHNGKVIATNWDNTGGGWTIKLDQDGNSGGYLTFYAHLKQRSPLNPGTWVEKGDVIGTVGGTGNVTGPHIHLALWNNSYSVKPEPMEGYSGFVVGQQFQNQCPSLTITSGPNTWQPQNSATFTWVGSDDQTPSSQLQYRYRIKNVPPPWSDWGNQTSHPFPNLPEGWHTVQVQVRDQAFNVTTASRQFGVDLTSPSNPTNINSGCTAQNNIWQNTCNDANFTWSKPGDGNGSGVVSYKYYWGDQEYGSPNIEITTEAFDPPAVSGPVNVSFLRMASKDFVGHEAEPESVFVLRYDTTLPDVAFQINQGAEETSQTGVLLNTTVTDTGSGPAWMRVSNNTTTWSEWMPYQNEVTWYLPALNYYTHTVYLQVQDLAGNLSPVVTDDIFINLFPVAPHSDNFRLCKNILDAGGSDDLQSNNFSLTSAFGQPWGGSQGSVNATYELQSGFLANMTGCLPITYTISSGNYWLVQSVIASAGEAHTSASFQMNGTLGQPFANEDVPLISNNFALSGGFWGGYQNTQALAGTEIAPSENPPQGMDNPFIEDQPDNFFITVNQGNLYVNQADVIVALQAPNVTHVRLNDTPDFADSDPWIEYQPNEDNQTFYLSWTIDPTPSVIPQYLYTQFKDEEGTLYGTYSTPIIYDPIMPQASVYISSAVYISATNTTSITLALDAWDDNSGVADMRISEDGSFGDAIWQTYQETVLWALTTDVVYVQFRDRAGNWSPIYVSDGSVINQNETKIYLPIIVR